MITRPAGRRDVRSGARAFGSGRVSAAVMAQRRALRLAARDTRLLGIPRMSQSYAGMRPMGELKGMDTSLNYAPVLATTTTNIGVLPVNLIQAGTGSWNRVGRKVCMKSLRLQGNASCDHFLTAGSDYEGNILRVIVVWDKQPSGGSEPLFNDIFGVTSQAGTETAAWFSPPKYDTMMRFTVVKEFQIVSNPDVALGGGNYQRRENYIDTYIRLPDIETNYSGQSSPMTIADINSGALYVIARAEKNDGTSTLWNLTLNARLRYTD